MHLQRLNPSLGCKIFAVKYIYKVFFSFFNVKKFANRSNSRKINQILLKKKIFPKNSQSFVQKKSDKIYPEKNKNKKTKKHQTIRK
jgi:hypothetical protein